MRRYQNENDYDRIRAFLRELFLLNNRRELSWQVARLDYWRGHGIANIGHGTLETDVFLWETADGQVAAVLNSEGPRHAYLQVHPHFRRPELEDEMIAVAEKHLAAPGRDDRQVLVVWAHSHDTLRQNVLKDRGFTLIDEPEAKEHQRSRPLSVPIPDASITEGYTIRSLGTIGEIPSRSWASWRSFHPNSPDEEYEGWDWYLNLQKIPLYRRDLDLVAIGPDGEVAAFCTIWYDDVTRTGYFEPVGTVPEHQRKGLGKAIMFEGLRRLERMGATLATVTGYSVAANALYTSVMGPEYDLYEPWVKRGP